MGSGTRTDGSPRRARSAVLLVTVLIAAWQAGAAQTVLGGATMGTRYLVRVGAALPVAQREALRGRIEALLARIDGRMSGYRAASEVTRFNAARGTGAMRVSADLVEVLRVAEEVSRWSAGAFDVTVAPLVALWHFGPWGPPGSLPGEAAIGEARARVDYRRLEIDVAGGTIRKRRPDLAIDLSGIAKGYAVDAVADLLGGAVGTGFLVEIGGEVRAAGRTATGRAWRVAVERPEPGRVAGHVLALRDEAVATSGDYRSFFTAGGVRYSHTIDPRSGRPVSHGLAAVSVLAPDATHADALATALMVMGPQAGLVAARRDGLPALLVVRSPGGFEEHMTEPFRARLSERGR